jgi:hypothetical protein
MVEMIREDWIGWPEGDGPEMHRYDSVAPPVEAEDDGFVPPLVLRARQMGRHHGWHSAGSGPANGPRAALAEDCWRGEGSGRARALWRLTDAAAYRFRCSM